MTADPVVMLVDNGSTRAAATLNLRRIAGGLSTVAGCPVHPVSLLHADRVPPAQLDGRPANVLAAFLRRQLECGCRSFVVVPLFFGPSRGLTAFIPQQVDRLTAEFGAFDLRQADVLSPSPAGEPRLAAILAEHVAECSAQSDGQPSRVVVVDHGSPLAQVTAVRERVAAELRARLPASVALDQAVMERRQGAAYDFNGRLLEDVLDACAPGADVEHVVLAMLFISPGRHAGDGGDIARIAAAAMSRNPRLRVAITRLVGDHPLLIEILRDRLQAVLAAVPG